MDLFMNETLAKLSHQHPIIVFDGVCGLCNRAVTWLIKRDGERKFRYLSLQDPRWANGQVDFTTLVLIDRGNVFTKSDAILQIGRHLSGMKWIVKLGRVVPRIIRDAIYQIVARHRYQIWGRSPECRIPTDEEKSLFV
jgi:predicted DCC family thiol-disulfide oxidoreductase YuxK